jgi:uncharacterized membrane protein
MFDTKDVEKAELWISNILRWGVVACALVILAGWLQASNSTIMIGLMLLIFLPITRVFAAAVIFFKQKDYIFVFFSTYVLIVLIGSLLLGKKI